MSSALMEDVVDLRLAGVAGVSNSPSDGKTRVGSKKYSTMALPVTYCNNMEY